MTNNPSFRFAVLLLILLSRVAGAANPLVALPEGDFVCVVDLQWHNAPMAGQTDSGERIRPLQKKITITVAGKIRRDSILWSDGKTSELWWTRDKSLALWEHNLADNQVILLRGDLINPVCPRLLFLTEESLSWISDKARVKTKDVGPVQYEATVVVEPATVEAPAISARFKAWVDPQTLLPLKMDDETALYTLKFFPRPKDDPMVMPPRIQEELDLWIATSTPKAHR